MPPAQRGVVVDASLFFKMLQKILKPRGQWQLSLTAQYWPRFIRSCKIRRCTCNPSCAFSRSVQKNLTSYNVLRDSIPPPNKLRRDWLKLDHPQYVIKVIKRASVHFWQPLSGLDKAGNTRQATSPARHLQSVGFRDLQEKANEKNIGDSRKPSTVFLVFERGFQTLYLQNTLNMLLMTKTGTP